MIEEKEKNQPATLAHRPSKALQWGLFGELGIQFAFIFAVPLIGAIYLGRWLDAKYNTKAFIIVCVLLAIALSWYLVIKRIFEIKKMLK